MIDEKTVFRILRYLSILTYEHYQTQKFLADKFNLGIIKTFTIQECLQNICKDFGLNYEVVAEHCELEKHD